MEVVDRGTGDPLVVIPGLQGRWEYVGPAIDRLAASFRVLTFPLCDEPSAGVRAGTGHVDDAQGIDRFVDHVERVLDARGIRQAAVCGISFGGLIALRFAATRPARTSALILVSTPGPSWHLKARHETYARLPHLFGPVFLLEAPFRLRQEIRAALPNRADRRRFVLRQLGTLARAPLSMRRMAARARMIGRDDREADAARVAAPTLIVHGEPALDHVVDARGTSAYGSLVKGAETVVMTGTGHLGSITRPDLFAGIVGRFLARAAGSRDSAA